MMKRLTFVFVYLIIVNIQLDESTIIKLLIYKLQGRSMIFPVNIEELASYGQ